MKLLKAFLIPLLAMVVAGCASFSTTVFRTESLAAETAKASVSAWNAYYRAATNGAPETRIQELNSQKDEIYHASREIAATLSVVESLRGSYETNSALKGQLKGTLATLSLSASNIVWIVTYFKTQ